MVAVFVASIVSLWLLLEDLGMQVSELKPGEGQVQVMSCRRSGVVIHRCQATVTAWTGEGPRIGDQVKIVSRGRVTGQIDVARGIRSIPVVDSQDFSGSVIVEVIFPRNDWIMPNWLRIITFITYGACVWALMWLVARITFLIVVRHSGSLQGLIRTHTRAELSPPRAVERAAPVGSFHEYLAGAWL